MRDDCPVAERLIDRVEPAEHLLGDKAYDSNELRDELKERGTKPVIPNRSNRKRPFSFSKRLYKGEVLNLLGIWRGASFADVNQQTGFGEPGKGAPHGDETTCFAAHA